MSQAIWTLLYAIAEPHRERYLDWFHTVHIPDKLARPGYTWAAHYVCATAVETDPDAAAYVACFGGTSSRVFYDPSPAQLKGRQDALTREMMGYRVGNVWMVYVEEWTQAATGAAAAAAPLAAPAIRLACVDAGGRDETLAAWLAQEEAPRIAATAGAIRLRKWLASSAGPRHAVVHEFDSQASCATAGGEMAAELRDAIAEPLGAARLATRLYPDCVPKRSE